MELFDPVSIPEHHFLLASHLPQGGAWLNAFDPNDDLGKIFLGLAVEFYRFQVLEKRLFGQINILDANDLLVSWEKSVGLPNSCFSNKVDDETRKKQVYALFSKFGGVQLKADFVRVAKFFGSNITVLSGKATGTFPLEFPLLFFSDAKAATHSLFIQLDDNLGASSEFPLPFPIPFSKGNKVFFQCIFDALAPANVKVIIVNKGDI